MNRWFYGYEKGLFKKEDIFFCAYRNVNNDLSRDQIPFDPNSYNVTSERYF